MKVIVVQYEPDTINEDDVEEMNEFNAAYFDPSQYHTYILPKDYEYYASMLASLTEHGLKYKLFKEDE